MVRPIAFLATAMLLAGASQAASAQVALPVTVETTDQAIARDAAELARQIGVTVAEATTRLELQEASVAATDMIRDAYAARLAGIAIEQQPTFRIVVLLTGSDPVADTIVTHAGVSVPIVFHTGAAATRAVGRRDHAISGGDPRIAAASPGDGRRPADR